MAQLRALSLPLICGTASRDFIHTADHRRLLADCKAGKRLALLALCLAVQAFSYAAYSVCKAVKYNSAIICAKVSRKIYYQFNKGSKD